MPRPEEPAVVVKGETRIEIRIVCASVGEIGHADHVWTKQRVSLAKRFMEKLTRDMQGRKAAVIELPYKTQVRVVSDWEDYDHSDDQ